MIAPSRGETATGSGSGPVCRFEILCLIAILTALFAALCYEAWAVGVTVDEPSHLLSADLYWQGRDELEPHDMPPLIKIAGGWAPWLLDMPLPPARNPVWESHSEWEVSQQMMARGRGARVQGVFFWSRLALTIFPLLTVALIWWWGRALWSPPTGLLLAALFALEPTALGHGALFKNDLAASFGYLLFWFAAWRFWKRPGWRTVLGVGAGLLLAVLAKLSMIILIPIAACVTLARFAYPRLDLLRGMAAALVVLGIAYAGAIAATQFDTVRLDESDLAALHREPALPWWFSTAANVFRLLPVPAQFWQGTVSLLKSNATMSGIYLFGDVYPHGQPLYFLAALAVKSPATLQILVMWGVILLVLAALRRKLDMSWAFVAVPPALYVAAASLSSLQLGIRLILPALAFGILLSGAAVERLRHGRGRAVGAVLFVLLGVQTAAAFPHGISFFNYWVGGPENGSKYLSDSNVDWGQDLPDLARWTRRHDIPHLRLFYFGNDNPYRFFSDDRLETLAPPWDESLATGPVFHPQPGIYAVSATLLAGMHFESKYRDYFREFRAMEPIGRAGYSIFIYRVDGGNVSKAPRQAPEAQARRDP